MQGRVRETVIWNRWGKPLRDSEGERMIGMLDMSGQPGSLDPIVIDMAVIDAISAVSFDQTSGHYIKSGWIKLSEVTESFARYLKRDVKLTKHVLWQPPAIKASGSQLFRLAWFISYPRDYPQSLLRVCLHFRWVIAFRLDPVSFSGGGNKHRAWSHSRENMNPKNNRRVLFNFFSQ